MNKWKKNASGSGSEVSNVLRLKNHGSCRSEKPWKPGNPEVKIAQGKPGESGNFKGKTFAHWNWKPDDMIYIPYFSHVNFNVAYIHFCFRTYWVFILNVTHCHYFEKVII